MKSSFIASLFVLLIAVVSTSASIFPEGAKRGAEPAADAEKWTNARRMANGLLPRKPTRLYTPSNVGSYYFNPLFRAIADIGRSTSPRTFRWPRVCLTPDHIAF